MSAPESDEEMGRQTELLAQVLADMRRASVAAKTESKPCRCLTDAQIDCTDDAETALSEQVTTAVLLDPSSDGSQAIPNGPFLRGLPHESTVRGLQGFSWVPKTIFAQWNKTLTGCLMSPLCGDCGDCLGFRI